MGLLNWIFGGSKETSRAAETSYESSTDDESDGEPEKERPYPVETESFSTTVDRTATGRFTRTVELVSAVNGQTILIEYDEREKSGRTTIYRGFSNAKPDAYRPDAVALDCRFQSDLIELNESNILSRKTLGSYNVSLEHDVRLSIDGTGVVDDIQSIPDDCRHAAGRPMVYDEVSRYDSHDNYVIPKDNGPGFHSYTRNASGFTHFEVDGEQKLVYVGSIRVKSVLDEISVEPSGSTPDVIAESIETGTDVMRAVLSDGRVVIPDSEQGLDGDGSDLMRIAELASER